MAYGETAERRAARLERQRQQYPELEVASPREIGNIDRTFRERGEPPTTFGARVEEDAAALYPERGGFVTPAYRPGQGVVRGGSTGAGTGRAGLFGSLANAIPQGVRDVVGGGLRDFTSAERLGNTLSDMLGEPNRPGTLGGFLADRGVTIPAVPGFKGRKSGTRLGEAAEATGIPGARAAFDIGLAPATWASAGIGPEAQASFKSLPLIARAPLNIAAPASRSASFGTRLAAETAIGTAATVGAQETAERTDNPWLVAGAGLGAGILASGAVSAAPRIGRAAKKGALGYRDLTENIPVGMSIRAMKDEPTVTLHRGDAKSTGPLSLTKGDPKALFGQGMYFTDNPDVARSYQLKGGANKPLLEAVVDTKYLRNGEWVARADPPEQVTLDQFYEATVNRLRRDANELTRPKHGGLLMPREQAERAMQILRAAPDDASANMNLRRYAYDLYPPEAIDVIDVGAVTPTATKFAVVLKGSFTGQKSDIQIPQSVLARVLDADAPLPADARDALENVYGTSFGPQATMRSLFSATAPNSARQVEIRRALGDLGYTGLRYDGGRTTSGLPHNAYVFWDEQAIQRLQRGLEVKRPRMAGGSGDEPIPGIPAASPGPLRPGEASPRAMFVPGVGDVPERVPLTPLQIARNEVLDYQEKGLPLRAVTQKEVTDLQAKIAREGMTDENKGWLEVLQARMFQTAPNPYTAEPPRPAVSEVGQALRTKLEGKQIEAQGKTVTEALAKARSKAIPPKEMAEFEKRLYTELERQSTTMRLAGRAQEIAQQQRDALAQADELAQTGNRAAAARLRGEASEGARRANAALNAELADVWGLGDKGANNLARTPSLMSQSKKSVEQLRRIIGEGQQAVSESLKKAQEAPEILTPNVLAARQRTYTDAIEIAARAYGRGERANFEFFAKEAAAMEQVIGRDAAVDALTNLVRDPVIQGRPNMMEIITRRLNALGGELPPPSGETLQARILPGLDPSTATGAVLGAAGGYGSGDTREEKYRNLILGAVAGGLTGRAFKQGADFEFGMGVKKVPGDVQGAFPGMEIPQIKDPAMQRALRVVADIANVPRSMQSSIDLSGSLRQAGFLAPRHRTEWKNAMGAQLRALGSEEAAGAIQREIDNAPGAVYRKGTSLYQADWNGTNLGQREEAFMSALAGKLPGVKQTGRAYAVMLNKYRADVFDSVVSGWDDAQRTPKRLEELAKYVNAATGRGNLFKSLEDSSPILNAVFFSPRFLASVPQRHLAAFTTDPLIRKEVIKDLGAFYGTGLTILGSLVAAKEAGLLPGVSIESQNFSSPDWGKVKIGPTRIDIWGGQQQFARLVARNLGWGVDKAQREDTKTNPLNLMFQYLRYKASPALNIEEELRTGKTAIGEPAPEIPEKVLRAATPLFLQELYDSYNAGGAKAAALTVPSFFGIGSSTYEEKAGGGTSRSRRPSRPSRPTRPTR